ncbi:MAG: M42 family peptidase [Chloroflexi bacterium]|nr:M42 family peptidase [Chloroflexota bacterium]
MKPLIRQLTEALGPSGREDAVRSIILREVKSLADDVQVDALGNVTAYRKPARNGVAHSRIMVATHMDEIGLVVSHIDKEGFVRFDIPGSQHDGFPIGARVQFLNGVKGVVGREPSTGADASSKMFVDVGISAASKHPLTVGEFGAHERYHMEMGNRLSANSLDARIGVAVLIEVMRRLNSTRHAVYFSFTVQGRTHGRGIPPAAYGIEPEIGIIVGGSLAGDTPGKLKAPMVLGGGPCVMICDNAMTFSPVVVDWMIASAQKAHIPVQRGVLQEGAVEAMKLQACGNGVLTGGLLIPVRYLHSTSPMVDLKDIEYAVRLVKAMLVKPIPLPGN